MFFNYRYLHSKRLAIYFLATFYLISLSGCNDDNVASDNQSDTRTVSENETSTTFETDRFTISLGSEWVYDSAASEAASSASGITCYYFYHTADDDTNTSKEHITISIEDLSSTGKDFSTFRSVITEQIKQNAYAVLSSEDTTINGYNAWKVKYDISKNSITTSNYLVAMNVENIIYSFTFTSDADDFDSYISDVDNFIKSAIFN